MLGHYHTKTITDIFEEQVSKTPDQVALIYRDKALTYHELNTLSNQVANYLIEFGVHSDVIVAVYLDRSFEMVIALLAILKAGGAYLPLDQAYPKNRLSTILADANVTCMITLKAYKDEVAPLVNHVVLIDSILTSEMTKPFKAISHRATSQHLAYVNYTSGSTGKPKGVAIIHQGVIRLLFNTNYVNLDSTCVFLQLSPATFDALTFELWGALLHGGRCVLLPEKFSTLNAIKAAIKLNNVTTLFLTTALFNTIIEEDPYVFSNVKQVLTGGESHSSWHMKTALEALPDTDIINVYGPTECTTFATFQPVRTLTDLAQIPIGLPISHTEAYVLDEHRQPVLLGAIGELYLGGLGLAREYINNPQLTEERFIMFLSSANHKIRLYKTGDLVQLLSDSKLLFKGRIDNQVKIHGYRIELDDIEHALTLHPKIKQAVVIAVGDEYNTKKLIAYLISAINTSGDEIKQYLKKILPNYMVPSRYQFIGEFPLTSNGKIDKNKLLTY